MPRMLCFAPRRSIRGSDHPQIRLGTCDPGILRIGLCPRPCRKRCSGDLIFSISDIRCCTELAVSFFWVSFPHLWVSFHHFWVSFPHLFQGFAGVIGFVLHRSVFRVAIWLNELRSPDSNQSERKVKVCNHPEASPIHGMYVNYLCNMASAQNLRSGSRVKAC